MTPDELLEELYQRVSINVQQPFITDPDVYKRVEAVSRNIANRAPVRVILACALAKTHAPHIDIRKPYTEIRDADAYSGRTYDERYVSHFVVKYALPCNPTTAFLTPALRNGNVTLTPGMNLSGRPRVLYDAMVQLLTDVAEGRVSAEDLLAETIRQLILLRNERAQRMSSLMTSLKSSHRDVALSAETIVTLIQQHLASKGSSRLPVLIVAAAYQAARDFLQEELLPLHAHNAADSQTRSLGDLQITLLNSGTIITCYEMKAKQVTRGDIDLAAQKLANSTHVIDNYIFITNERILPEVETYAASMYDSIGVEMVILDCISFLRHFLHLFHRIRMPFLDAYQRLVIQEPDSAVSQPLKEVFLALRQAAESDDGT